MSGKEKIYFLLGCIEDVRAITPSGKPLKLHPMDDLYGNYRETDLVQIFTKLEKDEQVLKVLKVPSRIKTIDIVEDLDPYDQPYEHDDGCWHIELLPAFDGYFLKIQQEPEYQEFTGKKPKGKTESNNKPSNKPTKYNRKALEKIWNLLQEIEEKRQLVSDDSPIRLPCYLNHSGTEADEQYEARKNILEKLSSLRAINNLHKGKVHHKKVAYLFWSFSIGDKYFDVFSEHEGEYKKVAQDYQQDREEEKIDAKDIAYEVKYSEKSREILTNNFLLAKPDFNSENEVVFSYLYQNANRTVKTAELEKQVGDKLKKPIHNILRDLGFTGKLAKAFFSASKNGVMFRNPITYQDLKDLGIERIKIQEKK